MNQPAILAGVCMLTMTISASLASPVASANAGRSRLCLSRFAHPE